MDPAQKQELKDVLQKAVSLNLNNKAGASYILESVEAGRLDGEQTLNEWREKVTAREARRAAPGEAAASPAGQAPGLDIPLSDSVFQVFDEGPVVYAARRNVCVLIAHFLGGLLIVYAAYNLCLNEGDLFHRQLTAQSAREIHIEIPCFYGVPSSSLEKGLIQRSLSTGSLIHLTGCNVTYPPNLLSYSGFEDSLPPGGVQGAYLDPVISRYDCDSGRRRSTNRWEHESHWGNLDSTTIYNTNVKAGGFVLSNVLSGQMPADGVVLRSTHAGPNGLGSHVMSGVNALASHTLLGKVANTIVPHDSHFSPSNMNLGHDGVYLYACDPSWVSCDCIRFSFWVGRAATVSVLGTFEKTVVNGADSFLLTPWEESEAEGGFGKAIGILWEGQGSAEDMITFYENTSSFNAWMARIGFLCCLIAGTFLFIWPRYCCMPAGCCACCASFGVALFEASAAVAMGWIGFRYGWQLAAFSLGSVAIGLGAFAFVTCKSRASATYALAEDGVAAPDIGSNSGIMTKIAGIALIACLVVAAAVAAQVVLGTFVNSAVEV